METQCKNEDYCQGCQIDLTKDFSDIISSTSLLKKKLEPNSTKYSNIREKCETKM